MKLKTKAEFKNPIDAVADAWASIDGKLDEYRAGEGLPVKEQPGGHNAGYKADAEELIRRIEKRGYWVRYKRRYRS